MRLLLCNLKMRFTQFLFQILIPSSAIADYKRIIAYYFMLIN